MNADNKKQRKKYIKELIKSECEDVLEIEDDRIDEIEECFKDIMNTSDSHPNESLDEYLNHTNYDN